MASAWAMAQRALQPPAGKRVTDGKRKYVTRETAEARLKELEGFSREHEAKRRERQAREERAKEARAVEDRNSKRRREAASTPDAVDGDRTRDVASLSVSEAG
jgi:hypothetical protein